MTESETLTASARLVAEKIRHTIDLQRADLRAIRDRHTADHDFVTHRLTTLEKCQDDHETRLRSATEGVTQFKAMITLTSVLATIISIVAMLITILKP